MRLRFPGPGLFVALLALTCQLALAAWVPRTADPLTAFGIICHAGRTESPPAAPLHGGPNCQFCPLCAVFTTAAAVPLSGSSMPAHVLRAVPLRLTAVAPATRLLSARPRGPPATA
jgi:hypothetical protein